MRHRASSRPRPRWPRPPARRRPRARTRPRPRRPRSRPVRSRVRHRRPVRPRGPRPPARRRPRARARPRPRRPRSRPVRSRVRLRRPVRLGFGFGDRFGRDGLRCLGFGDGLYRRWGRDDGGCSRSRSLLALVGLEFGVEVLARREPADEAPGLAFWSHVRCRRFVAGMVRDHDGRGAERRDLRQLVVGGDFGLWCGDSLGDHLGFGLCDRFGFRRRDHLGSRIGLGHGRDLGFRQCRTLPSGNDRLGNRRGHHRQRVEPGSDVEVGVRRCHIDTFRRIVAVDSIRVTETIRPIHEDRPAAGRIVRCGDRCRLEVGNRCLERLQVDVRCAGQAASGRLVPAVRAGVLAALHAEVECLVEGIELVGGDLTLGLAPGGGHRLVHRGAVGQHEVLEPARHHLHALEPQLRTSGFERVARATAFAERLGQDLGHRFPGYRAGRRPDGPATRTGREYSAGFHPHFHRPYLVHPAIVRGYRARRGFSGPSGRLRHRPCRHSPPSSGSSNACLSAPRHASSGRVCNPSSCSDGSSERWRASG